MARKFTFITGAVLGLIGGLSLPVPAMAEQENAAPSAPPAASDSGIGTPDSRARAAEILRQMLPPDVANSMASGKPTAGFGSEMSRIAYENAYVQLWARPGLSLKERSLITISILIALGNEKELGIHMASGLRNGLTQRELEEVIYHASAYAGLPRAADALAVATEVVGREGGK